MNASCRRLQEAETTIKRGAVPYLKVDAVTLYNCTKRSGSVQVGFQISGMSSDICLAYSSSLPASLATTKSHPRLPPIIFWRRMKKKALGGASEGRALGGQCLLTSGARDW